MLIARLFVALAALLAVACTGGMFPPEGSIAACSGCDVPVTAVDVRLILIGDTGELDKSRPALAALATLGAEARDRTHVVVLGDNVYPRGLPADDEEGPRVEAERRHARAVLDQQVEAVQTPGLRATFVPGNHDWDKSGVRGFARIRAQGAYLASRSGAAGNVRMLPADGCPGPVYFDLGTTVRVVAVDSEWLLRGLEKTDPDRLCGWGPADDLRPFDGSAAEGFDAALLAAVGTAGDRRVVIATHHPIETRGPHGGYFSAKQFFFPVTLWKPFLWIPLPGLYPVLRWGVVRSDQDLVGGRNRELVRRLRLAAATAQNPPLVLAAGHEHALQVFRDNELPMYMLVSGSGSKTEPVGRRAATLFKHSARGLMVLDYLHDGRVLLRVVEVDDGEAPETVWANWLTGSSE